MNKNTLYYWERGEKSSSSEVDYIISVDSTIYPIEVKSGKTGTLKSLNIYLQKYSIPFGIKISARKKHIESSLISIPLYLIRKIKQYIKQQENNT